MHPFQGFCQLSSKVNHQYYTIAVHLGNTLGNELLSKPSCLVLTGLYTKPRHINIALQGSLNVFAACHVTLLCTQQNLAYSVLISSLFLLTGLN